MEMASGHITKNDFKKQLQRIQAILIECISCLKFEDEDNEYGKLSKLASKALIGVKEMIFYTDLI